ncbi:hypothetical protein LJ725_26610 [Reyranella aquatilis]|uniref:PRTase-CE domain-containing protein n=1 Tax=Reyranella aquatilis TaxID=2035356 RepID=A0ABS8L3X4_9HYPH|nr:hypothetical protein [Reyranella aquatilis]MCC8432558.1 hypothetical protein [Reyranella aquatilis]
MNDFNAQQLLAKIMGWSQDESVLKYVPILQLLADFKYDRYQRFAPGQHFIESLALWLRQFDMEDRKAALDFVVEKLVYFSDQELSHLVQISYPDIIADERMRIVAEELSVSRHLVGAITNHRRFAELQLKSLYLGLSDGARTNELRRASNNEISNEQIWHAYELADDKAEDMVVELEKSLNSRGYNSSRPRFNLVWLIDDFSGSGNTYIRYDAEKKDFKGKLKKIYDRLNRGDLVDSTNYEVFLLLYVATRQAIDHIEYWADRFTSERGYKPLHVRVLCPIERSDKLAPENYPSLQPILTKDQYCDQRVADKHFRIGGTDDARLGFAGCALPVILFHNTPNNSLYILWGPEWTEFRGLFPRVSRHREF